MTARLYQKVVRPPKDGLIAFHVFTPALIHRLANPDFALPTIAVRDSRTNYRRFFLVHELQCFGPSRLAETFDTPLPGTGGRGVVFCLTAFPVLVFYRRGELDTFASPEDRDPKDILTEVLEFFTQSRKDG